MVVAANNGNSEGKDRKDRKQLKMMKNLCLICHKQYFGDPDFDFKSYFEENATENDAFDPITGNKVEFVSPVSKIVFRGLASMRSKGTLDRRDAMKGMDLFYKKRL